MCVDKKGTSAYLAFLATRERIEPERGEESSPNRQKEVDRVAKREHKPLSFLKNCIQLETTPPKRILAD